MTLLMMADLAAVIVVVLRFAPVDDATLTGGLEAEDLSELDEPLP